MIKMQAIYQPILDKLEDWRNQRIEGEFVYMHLDDVVRKRTWANEVSNVSILVVFGKYAEGDPYPGEQGSLGEESRIGNLETENHEAFLHCQNDGGGKRETQTYTLYPREHWRCIRTNNPMERIMRENRRKKKVVGNFSVGRSALMLVAARLRYISGRAY